MNTEQPVFVLQGPAGQQGLPGIKVYSHILNSFSALL